MAVPGATLGEMVNNLAGSEAAVGAATNAPGGALLGNAVSAAVTAEVLHSVQSVLDNVTGPDEVEDAAAQISSLLDVTAADAANLVQDALSGDLLGDSLESALNDMLTETVAAGIDELLGNAASGDLMNIVSGLLNGLNGAVVDPVALLAALNALGISLESLGLTEEHLNALLGLTLPVCGATGIPLVCATAAVDTASAVTVSSPAELQGAVNAMRGTGGTILLAPGNYGSLDFLSGMSFPGNLTIASADPNNAAVITSTEIRNLSNVTFANLNFFAEGTGALPTGSCGVADNWNWSRTEPKPCGSSGLKINGANNVTIMGSVFSGHSRGLFMSGENIAITGNTFTNASMDNMAFSNAHNLLIEGNYSHGIQPAMSAHNDHIQFWNLGGQASTDVTIRNNVLVNDRAQNVQGIFMFNEEVSQKGGGASEFYSHACAGWRRETDAGAMHQQNSRG